MATDVRVELDIDRPRSEVAAFMFDPTNDATWTTGVVGVRPHQNGRLRLGSRVERTSRFLGREFAYEYEVVEADMDRLVVMRVQKPFPMQIRYELRDTTDGRGTSAAIHATGEAGGFFRLAAPLLDRMVRRNIGRDLAALKRHLESG